MRFSISLCLASVVVLVLAMTMSAQGPAPRAPHYPLFISIKPIPAGMTGERILRDYYVSEEIGGGRTSDPFYALGGAEFRWLNRGVAVVDIEPGQVLKREYFRPLRG